MRSPVLSSRVAFWVSSAVVIVGIWASASPSVVYSLYISEWHLTTVITTALFATYPIALVVTLIVFGDISDYVGRRAAIVVSVGLSASGVLLFAVGPDLGWLFLARVIQGIGVGVGVSAASAAMAEFVPRGNIAFASSVHTASTAMGLTLSAIIGGALVEYAPYPTRGTFWVLVVVMIALFVLSTFLPKNRPGTLAEGRWHPKLPGFPLRLWRVVLVSSTAAVGAFAIGSLMIALGAQIAEDLIHTDNVLIAGVSIAVFAVAVAAGAFLGQRSSPTKVIVIGGIVAAIGSALLVLSSDLASMPIYLLAGLGLGAGNGLMFVGALRTLNLHAPARHRAGLLSVLYLVSYLAQGLVAFAIGLTAQSLGFDGAITLWSWLIGGWGVLAAVVAIIAGRAPADPSTVPVD